MNGLQKFLPLSEKVPVETTLDCIRYIEHNRNKELVRQYVESVMPFGEKASLKYRRRFFERFIETEGNDIIYTPLLKYINEITNYQSKKEVLYYVTCTKHTCVGDCVKSFAKGDLKDEISSKDLLEYFRLKMPDAKESSVEKTFNVVVNILKDFGILNAVSDKVSSAKRYRLNWNIRPTNEALVFCLYYEFRKIKDNKMPRADVILNADVFKYFLMSEPLIKKYLKWMMDEGYIENYVMGDNSQYQFKYDSLEQLVEKVVK
ncbi:hypothetical protein [Petroclostridium xylanilyticum]|jgi:hypothetical protein|uniref:hypothetical protein n=1 Tax=Petroclostridium xylanilyticum TaxID=1792311 RepID=UPI000B99C358|nr:hypothetical protein [Petroclostridium xylanilyticum]